MATTGAESVQFAYDLTTTPMSPADVATLPVPEVAGAGKLGPASSTGRQTPRKMRNA